MNDNKHRQQLNIALYHEYRKHRGSKNTVQIPKYRSIHMSLGYASFCWVQIKQIFWASCLSMLALFCTSMHKECHRKSDVAATA